MGYARKKVRKNENNNLSESKKTFIYYLHKRNSEARIKVYIVKIDKDKYEKLNFPWIYDTTPKKEILELVTLFFRYIRDCEIFISKSSKETEVHKAECLKAKKKVHRLFKGYLFDNVVNKWEASVESYTRRRYNMKKFKDILHLFLNKSLPHNTVN